MNLPPQTLFTRVSTADRLSEQAINDAEKRVKAAQDELWEAGVAWRTNHALALQQEGEAALAYLNAETPAAWKMKISPMTPRKHDEIVLKSTSASVRMEPKTGKVTIKIGTLPVELLDYPTLGLVAKTVIQLFKNRPVGGL